jgi:hypothetical protein
MRNFNTLLFIAVLLCLFGEVPAQDDTRSVRTWQVQSYEINARLPSDEKDRNLTVKAEMSIKNVSGKTASSLTLRLSPFAEVSAVQINGASTDFTKSEEKAGAFGSLQRIATRFPGIASDASLSVVVNYAITIKENSGVAQLTPPRSLFLPLSFWYPTPTSWFFPRGADRAPFKLKVEGGSGLTTVSSGAASGDVFDEKLHSQPFFVSGTWDSDASAGVDVLYPKGISAFGRERARELAALYSAARTFAGDILGTPPNEPLRIVAVRRGAGFSGGGTVFVDESVFRRPKIDSQTAMTIAEAAVRMWIGGSVDVNGDAHGVILEGLVKYIATEFIASNFGEDVASVERTRQRTAYATVSKRDVPMIQVSPLDEFYFGEVANKGAMLWRLLAKTVGKAEFVKILKAGVGSGNLSISEMRNAFSAQKDLVDYLLEKPTEMNLMVGLPQQVGTETRVALRNTGLIDATVNVVAYLSNGQTMESAATIKALSFSEIGFKSPTKVERVEVDSEKLYPQIEYSDDIAPRETTDSDLLLAVKRSFDKQDFSAAEKTARTVLASMPRYDEVRVLLARSLLGSGKTADAEREFKAVLDEKLPTARSMAWSDFGLAEIASRSNNTELALKYAQAAIMADSEYGASLAARNLRNKLNGTTPIAPDAKAFFSEFDKAAASKRKADLDALVMPGEVTRFAAGISGSAEQWQTQVRQVDLLDANTMLVETFMTVKMLNKDTETGMAVYRLQKAPSGWKLASVDMFEVR